MNFTDALVDEVKELLLVATLGIVLFADQLGEICGGWGLLSRHYRYKIMRIKLMEKETVGDKIGEDIIIKISRAGSLSLTNAHGSMRKGLKLLPL